MGGAYIMIDIDYHVNKMYATFKRFFDGENLSETMMRDELHKELEKVYRKGVVRGKIVGKIYQEHGIEEDYPFKH